jgi:hypothetical protein
MVRLVCHRVFQPSPDQPLDLGQTIEATLIELSKRFLVRQILFDPWQMQAVSQRLVKRGLRIEPFNQSLPNLTAASQDLFDLIQSGSILAYPDAAMRLAVSRAVAIETPRGWRIGKDRQTHKIDVVIALGMACLAAVQGGGKPVYDLNGFLGTREDEEETPQQREARDYHEGLRAQIAAYSQGRWWG